jgi:hypothetical protein
MMRRHAKELQQQAADAAAAAETAASEAAAMAARYDSTIAQLQQVLEQQGVEASRQLAELHARAEQQQQRLGALTQQLLSLLQLPQQQCSEQSSAAAGAGPLHQIFASSAGGAGSVNGSPLRNSSAQQQQWPGSPAGHGSPRRLTPQQQQQQPQQQVALPAKVQELCSALWAAVGPQSQPEEAAGAVHALISGLTQACVGLVDQAAELEATLAEAQAENEHLLADGTALAGGHSMLPGYAAVL